MKKKTTKKGNNSPKIGAGRYPLRSSRHGTQVLQSKSNETSEAASEFSSIPVNPAPRKRKRKRKLDRNQSDELSLVEKRLRYMLTRMKYEQNLIDAYSSEGWKGLSSEKIRPEKELVRAKSEILRCKIKVRHAFRTLDMLLLEGKLEDSLFDSKGEIDSEDIFCSKCGSKDLSTDNDIILCDGCCNRALHQKCVKPPLRTEEIPPGDERWLCPECVCKFNCLRLVNEFNGGDLSILDSWEKVFPEAARSTSGDKQLGDSSFPSDDSEDNDYDPNLGESDTENQNDASCSEGSDSTCSSDESGRSNQKTSYDNYLGLPSEDSEDDDYDPEGPGPCKDMPKEGPTSDGSDFSSDSDDFCAELCKISNNNEISKLPDDSGGARYMMEKHQPALESDPGPGQQKTFQDANGISGRRQRETLDYKDPDDETWVESSSGSSDDEEWIAKATPSKVNRDDNRQEISVMRETRSRSHEKQKKLCGANPKREDDHNVWQPGTIQIQVTPREAKKSSKGTNQISKHDESSTPISNGSKSGASVRRNSSQERSQKLHEYFKENQYPNRETKEQLSEELGITPKQVDSWFANTRHKLKVCTTKGAAYAGPTIEGSAKEAKHPAHSIDIPATGGHQPFVPTGVSCTKEVTIPECSRNNTKSKQEVLKSPESNTQLPNKTRDIIRNDVQHRGNVLEIKDEIDSERRKAIARELRRMKNRS